MAHVPGKGYEALRRGRRSSNGAEYFLTICTEHRRCGLTNVPLAATIWAQAQLLASEGYWRLRTGTLMPDHLHLLVKLGESADLTEAMRLFKGRLTPSLRRVQIRWQRGYFDHRLRQEEDCLPLFLYILLNPYRAQLIAADKSWPAYYCAASDWKWFEPLTSNSCPFPEWLQ